MKLRCQFHSAAGMFIFIIILLVFNNSYAQNNKEILIYVKPDIINVDLKYKDFFEVNSSTVKSEGLISVLKKQNIQKMKRAYAGFNLADTLRFTIEGKPIKLLNLSMLYKIELPSSIFLDSVIQMLSRLPGIVYAEKNGGWSLFTNDPHYSKQWYLKNTGQLGGTIGKDIKIEDAWQIFKGSTNVKVGVIGSGVKKDHEDLSGKVSGDDPDYSWHSPEWYDSYSHETHVAGIIAAFTDNSKGIAGVDQNTQLYSRRFFDSQNHQGDNIYIYNVIVDAVNNGCSILNNSWGGTTYSQTIRSAFAYAYQMNRVSVAAMDDHGNTGPTYPAAFGQGIIAVGSTNNYDAHSSFSETGSWIDVSAPGENIFSTVAYYNSSYSGYYDYLDGTSMAAPIVSGIASLLKGYNPSLYNDDIEHLIQFSADKVPDMNGQAFTNSFGYGRVNARRALDLLRSPYTLSQASVTGGTDVGSTDFYATVIYGAPGLIPDVYLVKRHEVRRTIYYNNKQEVNVWGRGVASTGWSIESPNYSMGWCDAVPGTVTSTSAALRTYVYEVCDIAGSFIGWYPTTPSNVVFAYTVHGKPVPLSASISGPSYLKKNQSGTWVVTASGGVAPYTYNWSVYVYCTVPYISSKTTANNVVTPDALPCDQWMSIYNTTNTESYYETRSFQLQCVVKDAVNSSYTVTQDVNVAGSILAKRNSDSILAKTKELVNKESLVAYPNPFNPTTRISFSLENAGYVSLKIFDILGKEVKTLIQDRLNEGIYEYEFNGSSLPSGIYICNLTAENKTVSKKILLAK